MSYIFQLVDTTNPNDGSRPMYFATPETALELSEENGGTRIGGQTAEETFAIVHFLNGGSDPATVAEARVALGLDKSAEITSRR